MDQTMYYIFCGLCLGGALGMLLLRGYVNSAMSMLVSMLGTAGLLLLMKAYFLAFVTVSVYAGAVLVLFVFVVMLVGDTRDGAGRIKRGVLLLLWIAIGAVLGYFEPQIVAGCAAKAASAESVAVPSLSVAKNYGLVLFGEFMLPFQIAGAMLLAAMVGVIVVAQQKTSKKIRKDA